MSDKNFPKITITGDLGSGKSVVSKLLQQATQFEIFSTGKIQREIAAKYNMTTLELNRYSQSHPEIDAEIDDYSRNLGKSDQSFIMDSRLAWFFIPHSFKIYLSVDSNEAARRILGDTKRKSESYQSLENARRDILERKALENSRFLSLYGADCGNMDNFDLVEDTTNATPAEVADHILQCFDSWKMS